MRVIPLLGRAAGVPPRSATQGDGDAVADGEGEAIGDAVGDAVGDDVAGGVGPVVSRGVVVAGDVLGCGPTGSVGAS
jgi:hypothetical protein